MICILCSRMCLFLLLNFNGLKESSMLKPRRTSSLSGDKFFYHFTYIFSSGKMYGSALID